MDRPAIYCTITLLQKKKKKYICSTSNKKKCDSTNACICKIPVSVMVERYGEKSEVNLKL